MWFEMTGVELHISMCDVGCELAILHPSLALRPSCLSLFSR